MLIAFSAVLLDITAEEEGTEERTQKNENKACALPHDPGETMTIKWPAADPPSFSQSLAPFLSILSSVL